MFGLVKIQEMIPWNKHIAENEFIVWNSASNMGYMAQNRTKMELVDGGNHEFDIQTQQNAKMVPEIGSLCLI